MTSPSPAHNHHENNYLTCRTHHSSTTKESVPLATYQMEDRRRLGAARHCTTGSSATRTSVARCWSAASADAVYRSTTTSETPSSTRRTLSRSSRSKVPASLLADDPAQAGGFPASRRAASTSVCSPSGATRGRAPARGRRPRPAPRQDPSTVLGTRGARSSFVEAEGSLAAFVWAYEPPRPSVRPW